jgi:hypothetical protein
MRRLLRACVLVDWHNVESRARTRLRPNSSRHFEEVIVSIQEETAKILKRRDSTVRYRAFLRIYHGWHVEERPTPIRIQFENMIRRESFARSIGIVAFTPEIRFGNELACDTPRNPLFNTSRAQGQKMIDTAIACDALYMLRTGITDVGIIVSDDDDFLPVAFTAEAWGLEAMLLRSVGANLEHVSRTAPGRLVCYWQDT